MFEQQIETKSRLIAKILRELLVTETFETLSDLTDALKAKCGRLKITSTPDDITNAFRMIASNRDLLRRVWPANVEFEAAPPRDLQPTEAKSIYREIMARYRAEEPKQAVIDRPDRPAYFPDLVVVR